MSDQNLGGSSVESATRRPFVVFIRHGPTYGLGPTAALGQALSKRFRGEIWTFSDNPAQEETTVRAGKFMIRRDHLRSGRIARFVRMVRLIGRGLALRWLRGYRLTVITYDPLRNGVVGVALKYLAGATFVCEVNGAYPDPNNLIDADDQEAAERRRSRMVRVGSAVLRHADKVKLLYDEQLDGFDVPEDLPVAVFPNLVDEAPFLIRRRAGRDRFFLFVGHPFKRKGVDVLLRAFAEVRSTHPDWRLVLIGFGLERSARDAGLDLGGVEFLGPVHQERVAELMSRCAALVLPSRSEAMGRVLLEAAFACCPRIGSAVTGIPSYIDHNEDGLLVKPADVPSLAQAMKHVVENPEHANRMGKTAGLRAEKEFTADAYASSYGRFLEVEE